MSLSVSLSLSLYSHTNKPPHIIITSLQLPIKSLRTHTIYSVYVTKESKNVRQMKPNTSCLFTCTCSCNPPNSHSQSKPFIAQSSWYSSVYTVSHSLHHFTPFIRVMVIFVKDKNHNTTWSSFYCNFLIRNQKHKNCMSTVYPVPALATTSQEVTISCQ